MASPYTETLPVTPGEGEDIAVVGTDPLLPPDDPTVGTVDNPAAQVLGLFIDGVPVSEAAPLPVRLDASTIVSPVDRSYWAVPDAKDHTLSLRRGLQTWPGADPAYDVAMACWDTWNDPLSRHGGFLFRPLTQDEENYLLAAPAPFDVAASGGFDVEVSIRATHPCLTLTTLAYFLNQSEAGPLKDLAVGVDRTGRLFGEWQDSTDTFHVIKFGPELGFIPPVDRYDVRVAVWDNGDGTATGWAWHKFDHDGPWLPLFPFIGDGSSFTSIGTTTGLAIPGLTSADPDFVTRTGPLMSGYARGEHFGFIAREASSDPIGSPGATVFQCDMTDGVGTLPGDTFTSNGDIYTLGADSLGVILDPDEAGWLYIESSGLVECFATVDQTGLPNFAAGSFTLGCRFTPTLEGSSAQYVRTVDLGAPPQPAGVIVGDLTAFALDHVVVLADGTVTIVDSGIVLTYMEAHDFVVIVDRDLDLLTVYVDGVARTPVDISTLGDITNANPWKFSGGGEAPTILHSAFLASGAMKPSEVAVVRSYMTGV